MQEVTTDRAIALPHGWTCWISDSDWDAVSALTLYRGANGYVYFSTWADGKSRSQTLHAFLMGGSSSKRHVDHRDGDPLNNRRSNLRFRTPQGNQVNRHHLNRNNSSGVRGVTWDTERRRWVAQITVDGRNHHLGRYASKETAIAARQIAELQFFGELCP